MAKYEFEENLQIFSHKVLAFHDGKRSCTWRCRHLTIPMTTRMSNRETSEALVFPRRNVKNNKLPEMIFETFTTYSHHFHARYVNGYINFINSHSFP